VFCKMTSKASTYRGIVYMGVVHTGNTLTPDLNRVNQQK